MKKHVSIWFIIGLQLAIFGLLILGVSIYDLYFPDTQQVMFENLHPGIYWGGIMLVLGGFYIIKFRVQKDK